MNFLTYRFRQIKKLPDFFYVPAMLLMKFMKLCMRTKVEDPYGHIAAHHPPAVTITWHNRLLFFPVMFEKWQRTHTVAMISASRDGQYISDLVKQFGIESVRGSSKKRGFNALSGAISALRIPKYLSMTPDGPRGPKYRMSLGPVYLASMEQVPVIPIAVIYSSYWQLKSWDNFQIPKPWSKVTLRLGEAVRIPKDLSEEDLEKWRLELETRLNAISEIGK